VGAICFSAIVKPIVQINQSLDRKYMHQAHLLRINKTRFISSAVYGAVLSTGITQIAHAQPAATIRNPLNQTAAGQVPNLAPPQAMPAPIGDGELPEAEIQGDSGNPLPVPTGQADTGSGSSFNTVPGGTNRAPILVKGSRRGNTLMQYSEVHPYPGVKFVTIQGKRYQYIYADSPASGYPRETNKWTYGGLPSVRTLSRYLVILGVVVATILMAFGAYGVVLGEQNAGTKIIHTAGGLMLLFMAFTIWKLVQANMVGLDDQNQWDANTHKPQDQILLPETVPDPVTPQAPLAPQRSGVPVLPDSGN
jgi:hypothetical protein